jgi:hypothetical protein
MEFENFLFYQKKMLNEIVAKLVPPCPPLPPVTTLLNITIILLIVVRANNKPNIDF